MRDAPYVRPFSIGGTQLAFDAFGRAQLIIAGIRLPITLLGAQLRRT